MRRVVHVLGPSAGGIRRHVRYIAAHPPPGWETLRIVGPPHLAGYFTGLPFRGARGGGMLRAARGADLVHAHGLTPGAIAFLPWRPPLVVTLHMDVATQGRTATSRTLRSLAPRIARRAEGCIAVSERIARGFPWARVIPPAVELPEPPRRSRPEVRGELGTPAERVVVLAVARLHRDKGLDTFIDGVRRAGAEGWIAGDGPLREELERAAAGSGVRLLGYRSDIGDLLGAADIFALPSVGEGYGIAVMEALTHGLPVVATDAGAMPELVGDAGLLVPPGDRVAFAEGLSRLVGDIELRERTGARARARRFPPPAELVGRVGDVYDEVVGTT